MSLDRLDEEEAGFMRKRTRGRTRGNTSIEVDRLVGSDSFFVGNMGALRRFVGENALTAAGWLLKEGSTFGEDPGPEDVRATMDGPAFGAGPAPADVKGEPERWLYSLLSSSLRSWGNDSKAVISICENKGRSNESSCFDTDTETEVDSSTGGCVCSGIAAAFKVVTALEEHEERLLSWTRLNGSRA
jgi:hypothetical protein